MTRVEWHGDAVAAKVLAAADEALNTSAELVAKDWQETVPYALLKIIIAKI